VHPYPHFFPHNLSDSREAKVISELYEMVIEVYAFDSVDTRLPSGRAMVADKGDSDNVIPIATHGYSASFIRASSGPTHLTIKETVSLPYSNFIRVSSGPTHLTIKFGSPIRRRGHEQTVRVSSHGPA
jgi:hypothetical protein